MPCYRDIGKVSLSPQANDHVVQTDHHTLSLGVTDRALVLPKCDIADIVKSVLNVPTLGDECMSCCGEQTSGVEAGDTETT